MLTEKVYLDNDPGGVRITGTCPCGRTMKLYGRGDEQCKCGRWYNSSGQELVDPSLWEEGDED